MKYKKGDLVYPINEAAAIKDKSKIPIGVWIGFTKWHEDYRLHDLHHVWWLDMKEAFWHDEHELALFQAKEER